MAQLSSVRPPTSLPPRKPDADHDDADRDERRELIRELSAPKGAVVYAAIHQEGEDELARGTSSLAWSALAAGLSMGFSFATEALLYHALPESGWRPVVSRLGYSIGFLIVILGRQQLFTENTLTVILPLLRRRTLRTLLNVARLWTVVLLANLVGALLFAVAIATTTAFPDDMAATFTALGTHVMSTTPATVLIRGVFAGWLIALMVWLLPYAETSRVWVIIIITYVVGLGEFSHVVAGSVDVLYLVVTGQRTVFEYLGRFLGPALVGNIIGGVSLVAALAHAQFVGSSSDGEEHVADAR